MLDYRPRGEPRFTHQKHALRRIVETRGVCALLMDPGTGKTAVTIDYASLLALKTQRPIRVLVLAPLVALDSWVGQAAKYTAEGVRVWAEALGGTIPQRCAALAARGPFRPNPREGHSRSVSWAGVTADGRSVPQERGERLGHWNETAMATSGPAVILEVVSLDSLSHKRQVSKSRTTTDIFIAAVKKFTPDLIVVDESHRIKGASSNVSRAAARLTPLCPRRLILTGTVMSHSPLDVWGQWSFLEPRAFVRPNGKPMPFGSFQNRYATFGGYMGKQVMGFRNLDEMKRIMERNSVVVRKEDALDLPPVTDIFIRVRLSSKEQNAYDSMKTQLAAVLENGSMSTVGNRLSQMMRLRQITSGYLPDDNGTVQQVGTSKTDAVRAVVCDSLAGEKRVVVFAHFRKEVADLAESIRRSEGKGAEVMVITGDTPPAERERLRKRFGSDSSGRIILVAQMRTLSLAVNELVTASHAVFASLSERRDDFVQARDRLNRIGQKRPVTFWNIGVPNSVDEVIHTAHRDRKSVEDAMLAHVRENRSN